MKIIDKTVNGAPQEIAGHGKGFSVFFGLSSKNSMWVADFNEDKKCLENKKLVEFKAGDCLLLPYGTIHAGDRNNSGYDNFKTFTDFFERISQQSDSQLWVVEGRGYSKKKPYTDQYS